MPPRSLIDSLNITTSGGVSGRRGYKYQDHIASGVFLDMLGDPEITQIECETADDIVVRKMSDAGDINEYIQVKTTENDYKWSISELKKRDKVKNRFKEGTSLIEKSLACDRFSGNAQFRFVSSRDVRAELMLFKVPREKRQAIKIKFDELVKKFTAVYASFVSAKNNNIECWARNMLWEVEHSEDSIMNKNVNRILSLASNEGAVTSHAHAQIVYARLLCAVGDAADAIAAADPDAKAITRAEALTWWSAQLGEMRTLRRSEIKVYQFNSRKFFDDLHEIDEPGILRKLSSYDVAFDFGEWRGDDLIDYLLNWLPEVVLPARVLANHFGHTEARALLKRARDERKKYAQIDDDRLLAELMLHAIMRHHLESEPIPCRLFALGNPSASPISAHLIRQSSGDELWLSRAYLTTATTYESIVSSVTQEMKISLTKDYLREERDLIIQLREPQHMRLTDLEAVLDKNSKLQDLLKVIRLPLLVAYDSTIIGAGYCSDYVAKLTNEVSLAYEALKPNFIPELASVQVNVFLIPIEDAQAIVAKLHTTLETM
ncbi:dsDNA nuclease domain-containing protein [Methylorubrum extorquens]|uniref:HamA C-terminal domain-containing protein n=1 Tax=Methylorubrum extorquens TaxID=408 RepID=UPI002238EBA0|nr:dsDNA nuclease domain-containing protein [Methylorubrum extorquens]UYW31251.1 dsDNA nuclease domain-containing protein [Methylorubrum extorquens]